MVTEAVAPIHVGCSMTWRLPTEQVTAGLQEVCQHRGCTMHAKGRLCCRTTVSCAGGMASSQCPAQLGLHAGKTACRTGAQHTHLQDLPLRPGSALAMTDQFWAPCLATRSRSCSSSCGTEPGMATMCGCMA